MVSPSDVRRIAINTGGGDAPGLNAVIRAVTLAGLDRDTGRRGGKLMLRFAADNGSHAQTETTVTDERHDPNLAGVVLNVRDVTEHHRLEEQMQQGNLINFCM